MRRLGAALVVVLAVQGVAEGKPPPRSAVRRAGAMWLSADVDVRSGASLLVSGRLEFAGLSANACYIAFAGQPVSTWQTPSGRGPLRCEERLTGPVKGRLVIVLASRVRAARSVVAIDGASVRGIRSGGMVHLLREQDFTRGSALVTFKRRAVAFFSTGPHTRGAAVLSQTGPSKMTNWVAGDRAYAFADGFIVDGKPGRYEFTASLLVARDWLLLAVADVT